MNSMKNVVKNIEHWKVISACLVIYDIIAVNFSYFMALWLRFDTRYSAIPIEYLNAFIKFSPFYTIICIVVFWRLHLYNSIWRFASYNEMIRCIAASFFTAIIQTLGITLFFQ